MVTTQSDKGQCSLMPSAPGSRHQPVSKRDSSPSKHNQFGSLPFDTSSNVEAKRLSFRLGRLLIVWHVVNHSQSRIHRSFLSGQQSSLDVVGKG